MRVLASTGPMFGRPFDWTLGVLADAGYDGAELMVTSEPVTQDAGRLNRLSDREGVPIPVVHGPFLLLTRRVFGTDLVAKAVRSRQLAAELGADVMIVHPPLRWQLEFHRWLADPAEAATSDVRVGVENLYPISVGARQVRLHRYTEPHHLAPFPNVVLDTSHLGVSGVDLGHAYRRLRHQVVHLHVSDYRGGGRDSHAPLGHGQLPLGRFLGEVGADERNGVGRVGAGEGSITLELDCRRYLGDRAALVDFLRHEREKCQALLEGVDAAEVLGRPDDVAAVVPGDGDEVGPAAPPALHPARD